MKMINKLYKTGIFAVLMLLLFSVQMVANDPGKGPAYALVNANSTLHWSGSKPGGGHHGVIDVINGELKTNGTEITGGSFNIDMGSIVCKDLTNEAMNKKLVDHLKSEDFFYVEAYPQAVFNITGVRDANNEMAGDVKATHVVTGDLTIRGITQRVTFPAMIEIKDHHAMAKTGEISLDRTRWDITTMSKSVFAELKDRYVDDEFIVKLDLQFKVN